jgi:hypothetical protein
MCLLISLADGLGAVPYGRNLGDKIWHETSIRPGGGFWNFGKVVVRDLESP